MLGSRGPSMMPHCSNPRVSSVPSRLHWKVFPVWEKKIPYECPRVLTAPTRPDHPAWQAVPLLLRFKKLAAHFLWALVTADCNSTWPRQACDVQL